MFQHERVFSSFSVDDVPAAEAFYGTTLGLDVRGEGGVLWLRTTDGAGVLIYPKPDHIPASFTLLNFVVPDVDRAVDDLTERGVRFLRFDQFGADERGVVRGPDRDVAWFADPAGNVHSVARLNAVEKASDE